MRSYQQEPGYRPSKRTAADAAVRGPACPSAPEGPLLRAVVLHGVEHSPGVEAIVGIFCPRLGSSHNGICAPTPSLPPLSDLHNPISSNGYRNDEVQARSRGALLHLLALPRLRCRRGMQHLRPRHDPPGEAALRDCAAHLHPARLPVPGELRHGFAIRDAQGHGHHTHPECEHGSAGMHVLPAEHCLLHARSAWRKPRSMQSRGLLPSVCTLHCRRLSRNVLSCTRIHSITTRPQQSLPTFKSALIS